MKPILFAGTASPGLGKSIARLNDLETGRHEVVQFANSETKATIMSEVYGRDCVVVQSTSNPTNNNLVELLLTMDALRREGAEKVSVIIPYFGYARQNIQHRKGECVSAHVVVTVLESLGAHRVMTTDIHDESMGGIFSIPFRHLSALPLIADRMYADLGAGEGEDEYVVGSPDQGGIERARYFAEHFYRHNKQTIDTVVVEKKRDLNAVHQSKSIELFGNVKGKKVILVDDVATSGQTIFHAAEASLQQGAKAVYAAVVHPDFAPGIPKAVQGSVLEQLYTTNTIERTIEDLGRYPKIKVLDASPIFKL